MELRFQKFSSAFYPEYSAWFQDPELNRQLGPMDADWLNYVLAEEEVDGITWAVFDGDELVGVVETVFDRHGQLPTGITAIAVRPDRRRQGIGFAILQHILRLHVQQGLRSHLAFLNEHNLASRGLFEKLGFRPLSAQPDKNGYLEYRREENQ